MLSKHMDATDLHVVYLGVLLSGIGVFLARSQVARSAELRLPAAAGVSALVVLFLAPLILTKAWGRREEADELRGYLLSNLLNVAVFAGAAFALVYVSA